MGLGVKGAECMGEYGWLKVGCRVETGSVAWLFWLGGESGGGGLCEGRSGRCLVLEDREEKWGLAGWGEGGRFVVWLVGVVRWVRAVGGGRGWYCWGLGIK